MNTRSLHWLWAWLLMLCCSLSAAEVAVPPRADRVTDLTATLHEPERASLEAQLSQFEQKKGAQLAVLMLPSTAPETIEQYAVRVFETWRLGRRGVDDGVLLVVAKDDRRVRIEVGYGLEGVLPDAVAKRIISEDITPRFKSGDFPGGIRAGLDHMMRVIEGEPLPPVEARPSVSGGVELSLGLALLGATVFGWLFRRMFGRVPGALVAGAVIGAIVGVIGGGVLLGLLAGAVVFIITVAGDLVGWSIPGSGGGGGGYSGGGFSGGGGASGGW